MQSILIRCYTWWKWKPVSMSHHVFSIQCFPVPLIPEDNMLLGSKPGCSLKYGQFFLSLQLSDRCVSHSQWRKATLIALGPKVTPYLSAEILYGLKQLWNPSTWKRTFGTMFLSCKNLPVSPFTLQRLLISCNVMNSKLCFTVGKLQQFCFRSMFLLWPQ